MNRSIPISFTKYDRHRAAYRSVCAISLLIACVLAMPSRAISAQKARLRDHIPPLVQSANLVGRTTPTENISLALTLPLRSQDQLNQLLARLYDPEDPLYGHYLTPEQFKAQFAPTRADYDTVIAFARANGLTVTGKHDNRLVLDVTGPVPAVENAFGLHLQNYRLPEGRVFRAPDSDPVVPASLASRLQSVVGLDTAAVWQSHSHTVPVDPLGLLHPNTIGTGPGGGMSPSDVRNAYNLNGISQNGSGQTLGVFELDGYTVSDINAYESQFGLPNVPLQNVLVDGASGAPGSGASEVTLDIELQIALAPGISKIMVYEGANSNVGVLDTYNRMATDNVAKSISTSWGVAEAYNSPSFLNSENAIFQQMAAQGQSIFAAGGDTGAYDDGRRLSVDDPASQPYVTGAGGTTLTTASRGGPYGSETTWNSGSIRNGAGGGGISAIWSLPSYQSGFITSASHGSTTMRNVPDVSLNADPNTGYAIYFQGSWQLAGGTSCASPLWAAFTALVNQQRTAVGIGPLGFANASLYTVARSAYANAFHDIADGSNNLYYPAIAGYDCATGLGSFNGANLLADLSGGTAIPSLLPLYRLYLPAVNRHLLTSNQGEMTGLTAGGWILEGVEGNVYAAAVSGTVPLYRLYNPYNNDHLYTTSAAERAAVQNAGYLLENITGYVCANSGSGLHAVYRLFNSVTGEHLFTSSLDEYNGLPAPWNREGITGYIW